MQTTATAQVETVTLAGAGARKPRVDSATARILADVQQRTGSNTVGRGGPWPDLDGPPAPTDSDGDGMPDAWEVAHGLNPQNASDGPAVASNGYTNVENYLNELAGDGEAGPTQQPLPAPKHLRLLMVTP